MKAVDILIFFVYKIACVLRFQVIERLGLSSIKQFTPEQRIIEYVISHF